MRCTTSKPTRDPGQIRLWAASQNAMPAELLPGLLDSEPSQLHFFIPGISSHQPRLRIIGWEDFFAAFEAHGLTFVYEIHPDGRPGKHFELLQAEGKSPADVIDHQNGPHDSDSAPEYAE